MNKQQMEEPADEELVQRVVGGNTQAYATLVRRYQRPVYNLMYRFSRSETEAADLCQEVFLKCYERLACFDRKRRFFPWLYTLALNLARDWQRSHVRTERKLDRLRWETERPGRESEQEEALLGRDEVKQLYAALDQLPPETRELILLRFQQDVPIRELAEIFELSESGIKMRISRALARMKTILGGNRYDG